MEFHWDEKSHLGDFINLNTCWIEKYFCLEPSDNVLFSDPGIISRNGGYVLSVTVENKVVGVCALMKISNTEYELARMAVAELEQGKGIGKLILDEVSRHARQVGIKKLTLVSNTKLGIAIGLYQRNGFMVISEGQHPVYNRGNIVMEKRL